MARKSVSVVQATVFGCLSEDGFTGDLLLSRLIRMLLVGNLGGLR